MLYMIGYDLREPRYDQALLAGVKECAEGVGRNWSKIPWGPFLLDSELTADKLLRTLQEKIRSADPDGIFNDKLLIVPLGEKPLCALRNLPAVEDARKGLGDRLLLESDSELDEGAILAIAYTLHRATEADYRDLRKAIWKGFTDCTNPLHALWFVQSNKTPAEVLSEIERELKDRNSKKKDQVLVIQVDEEIPLSDVTRVRRDTCWLWEHGIDSKHTLLEASTPRRLRRTGKSHRAA